METTHDVAHDLRDVLLVAHSAPSVAGAKIVNGAGSHSGPVRPFHQPELDRRKETNGNGTTQRRAEARESRKKV